MKSIKISVPKALIKSFHPHPDHDEPYYVVTLLNGMYTDVWQEENTYITMTNDEELISFLILKK